MQIKNMEQIGSSQQMSTQHQILNESKQPCNIEGLNLNLKFGLHRLFTFISTWNYSISKEQLADSGFYLTAEANSVQCHFCNLEVTDRFEWEHTDVSIDSRHQELNSNCPFIRGDETTNLPIGEPTNYRYESHRLYTFLNIDWNYPVSQFDLAKHGFYWTGSIDCCRCAFCRLEVSGWEMEDSAEGEHRLWNPLCLFIIGRTVGNVPIGTEDSDDAANSDEAGMVAYHSLPYSLNSFMRVSTNTYSQIRYTNLRGPRPPIETLGVTPIKIPRHPNYTLLNSRINSYNLWPIGLPQNPYDLAEAGFYYTGTGDRVICFQCGGGLKDWAPTDTPWCEHAKWFSHCPYLLLKKGKEYVERTLVEKNILMPVILSNRVFSQEQPESENNVGETVDTEKNNTEGRNLKCLICSINEIETVNLPCGHMVSCMSCIDIDTECRKCKKTRVAYVRTFLQ